MGTRQESLLISVLLITTLAHVLDFVIMMPLGPLLMRDFQISAAEFGHLVSVYTVAAAISSFFSAFWIDRINRKTGLLLLLIGFTAGNLLCVWAPSVRTLLFGRIIAGLFGGVMNAIVFSIVGQLISLERRGRATGLLGTAFPLVSIIGIPLALKLADIFGWRIAFYLVLGVSCIAFFLSLFALPSVAPQTQDGSKNSIINNFLEVVSHRPHQIGLMLMVLVVLGGFTIVPYIAPFLINNGYILDSELYVIYLFGGACAIVSSRVFGNWSDAKGKVHVLRYTLVLTIFALLFFTNLPHHSLALVTFATCIAMMFLPARMICTMAFLTIISKPEQRGAYMSLVSTTQQLAIGIASLLGGYLVGESADGRLSTFWLAGAFAIGANLVIFAATPLLSRLERNPEG